MFLLFLYKLKTKCSLHKKVALPYAVAIVDYPILKEEKKEKKIEHILLGVSQ